MAIRASVFIAASVDGYIARSDGGIDWLGSGDGAEDYGYSEFFDLVDVLVVGRNSYEKVLSFPEWPYGEKKVVVLTSRPLSVPAGREGIISSSAEAPEILLNRLGAEGVKRVYVDGGVTIQRFLSAGAIDDLTITWIPVLLGTGIPLFGPTGRDIFLRHVRTRAFPNGYVQSTYEVESPVPVTQS